MESNIFLLAKRWIFNPDLDATRFLPCVWSVWPHTLRDYFCVFLETDLLMRQPPHPALPCCPTVTFVVLLLSTKTTAGLRKEDSCAYLFFLGKINLAKTNKEYALVLFLDLFRCLWLLILMFYSRNLCTTELQKINLYL